MKVSISLSSGFSFQVRISSVTPPVDEMVSISLSSGFSFQVQHGRKMRRGLMTCFNLVIERLLISGICLDGCAADGKNVSISLSSGFSFQVTAMQANRLSGAIGFNLVIERLLISGPPGNTTCIV